jgi:nucleoporin POM152
VTDIMQDTYTISSSLPGDYTVTSVSDRFCRYPPLSKGREIK